MNPFLSFTSSAMNFTAAVSLQDPKKLIKHRRSLTLNACAHCVFFCKVLLYTRDRAVWTQYGASRLKLASHSKGLRVGIIGAGHLGKQLARCLIDATGLQAEDIRISTRRPQTLRDFQEHGVLCYYDNVGLATWAHVIFVCCLPSQLPALCTEIRSHVGEACIVYSLVSSVPLPRLHQLLGSRNVIRPEYQTVSPGAFYNVTLNRYLDAFSSSHMTGLVRLMSRFIETTIYAALNMCTEQGLFHGQSLDVLNAMIHSPGVTGEVSHHSPLRADDIVSQEYASTLSETRPFPWFDLCSVQMKETPFSQNGVSVHLFFFFGGNFAIFNKRTPYKNR
uniref:NADP-dependent oxidoreductase domain-containing protein 1 n=1 Tax=Leptobrachium leishanense TaxID=445787 RepID=A0A8C5QJN8_9ANUR